MEKEYVKRIVNYYYLNFEYHEDNDSKNPFVSTFHFVLNLSKQRKEIRYQLINNKIVAIRDLKFEPSNKILTGKLLSIRKDLLPELMNTFTDEERAIDAGDEEGTMETTHFVIDYSKNNILIAIEYNQFGSKIGDFVKFIKNVCSANLLITKLNYVPVIQDKLPTLVERIRKYSEFLVKIHKKNIDDLKEIDHGLHTSFKKVEETFNSGYVTLVLNVDYKNGEQPSAIFKTIQNVIKHLRTNKLSTQKFEKLSVRAEDSEKDFLLETFDLLIDKVKTDVRVEKKKRHRSLVSSDMFFNMKNELNILRNEI